jgi:HK97 family phage portal protein
MRLSAVYACLRLLSEAISTLPTDTFYRQNGVRKPYRPRPGYLSFQPPQGNRIDYLSQVMLSLLTDGNAYVLTPRDAMGIPVDLIVLDPMQVNVQRVSGKLHYDSLGQNLDPTFDIMHIKGMCLPGQVTGVSPITYARETIGLGLAAQEFGAAFFNSGALPSAVIEAPQGFNEQGVARFRDTWNTSHSGIANAQKVGVLLNGAKLNKVSIQPNDAQFLETRAFQVPDIARFYGVPPHLIADASNSTSWGTGLAEQNTAFGALSLGPWIARIEEDHSRLLTTHGLPGVFWSLNTSKLLAPSLKEQTAVDAMNLENGVNNVDEIRASRDLGPLPNGKGQVYRDPAAVAMVSPQPNKA